MQELTIGQTARRAGVRPSTLRYYESIDLLPVPRRVGGQRRYDPAILEHLAFIHVAQKLGFTLTEIQLLFHNREEETPLSDRWRALASHKLAEVDTLIQQATGVKRLLTQGLRCGCVELLDCIECVLQNCDEPAAP
jgi:MerR family transcriptional regulator, redox-sensitive transcriptional activator SoxR